MATTAIGSDATDLISILQLAMAGSYVAHGSGQTFTVSKTIVINVTSTTQGPLGLDLAGGTIVSQITDGSPVIKVVVGPGVDLRYLTFANFTIQGNGKEGDGIQIVAGGNDRWVYNFTVDHVTVNHVGGNGLDVQGSVFEGIVSNSWMTNNGQSGAYFSHLADGQASALRWVGGGLQNNGAAGMMLDNGVRDMSVDGAKFIGNQGGGISAGSGITAVSNSLFQDNKGQGVWVQNYGNFDNDTFTTSGVQTVGVTGWLNGNATVVNNSSIWTGSGADPTTLANLQGYGGVFAAGDTGKIVTGSSLALGGADGGNLSHVSVSALGVALPALPAVNAATTAALATTNGTSAVETALKAAVASGGVHLTDTNYTVSAPIVINLTSASQGPINIDFGDAKIQSTISGGGPVIEIIVGAGVNVSQLTISNLMINGNGGEGDGIKIIADGADRSIKNLSVNAVNIEHVGGIGLDVVGNVHGTVFDSWMNGNNGGGARFANSANGGVADSLFWIGGGFRKNGVAGLILDNGTKDMTVKDAYFVENVGVGIDATSGITLVKGSGFENNGGTGAVVQGTSTFVDDTFSTWGVQKVGIGGYLNGGQVNMTGVSGEYYGSGSDPTAIANLQGTGKLAIAGSGNVIAGPGITVTGGVAGVPIGDPTTGTGTGTGTVPIVTETLVNDTGTSASDGVTSSATLSGTADPNSVVHFAVDGAASVATATANASGAWSFIPTGLADGSHTVVASETNAGGATGTASLTFTLDTTAASLTEKLASDSGASATDKITSNATLSGTADPNSTIKFTVDGTAIAATATANASGAWSFTPTGLANGQHTIAASQTDTAGNTGMASLTFTLDTTAASLTEKLASDSGASATDKITSNATLSGTADPNSTIKFTVDGTAIAATATANASGAWSFTPTGLADGQHTIAASQTDTAGNTGTASLAFTLDATAPIVTESLSISALGSAIGTTTSAPAVRGTAEANSIVHFRVDGSAIADTVTADATGAWSYTSTSLAAGTHVLVASQTDIAGNTGSASVSFSIQAAGLVGVVPTAPVVTIALSSDTGSSASDRITSNATLSGTADPNSVVHFAVDGTASVATATANASGAWSFIPTGLADGTHTVVASETNAGGTTGTASLTFTEDTTAPVPVFTGGTWANGQATITGSTGSAGDVVSIYDGSSWAGFATTDASGKFSFTTAAIAGSTHSYGGNATDLAGNEGHGGTPYVLSAATTTTMPVVTAKLSSDTGASATDGVTWNPAVTGTADPNAVVHFAVDGTAVAATATANANGVWSYSPNGLADGFHTVTASETNASGSTGAAFASFTLDPHAPLPIFTGASLSAGKVTLAGTTGEAGDSVSIYDGNSWLGFAATGSDGSWSFAATASNVVHSYGANAASPTGSEGHGSGKAIVGTTAADTLTGGAGNDVIIGAGGNDTIAGGGGADRLTGGPGNVTFTYTAAADSTAAVSDTITDFRHGGDKIDFSTISGLNASGGIPTFQGNITGAGNLTLNAHSVAFLEAGGNTQVLVNTSNAAEMVTTSDVHAADMKIVLLGVNLGLTGSDFHHN